MLTPFYAQVSINPCRYNIICIFPYMYLTDTIFYVFPNMYRTDKTQPTLFLYFVFFHQIFTPKQCIQGFLKQAKHPE